MPRYTAKISQSLAASTTGGTLSRREHRECHCQIIHEEPIMGSSNKKKKEKKKDFQVPILTFTKASHSLTRTHRKQS